MSVPEFEGFLQKMQAGGSSNGGVTRLPSAVALESTHVSCRGGGIYGQHGLSLNINLMLAGGKFA